MVGLGRRSALAAGVALGAAPGLVTSRLADTWHSRWAGGVSLSRDRIDQPHGARTGDVTTDSAVVWARSAADGRMMLRLESNGRRVRSVRGPWATLRTDRTARVVLRGLAPGREYVAQVWFAREDGARGRVERLRFRTAPTVPAPVSFAWSGDTCGQGWGINDALGGLTGYRLVGDLRPDFFLHCGDTIYADEPMDEHDTDHLGHRWTNRMTEAVSKVAETLEDFRGRHRYVLGDQAVRSLYREVPTVAMWDDHETLNNWYPGEVVTDRADEYRLERRCDVLAARGRRAWQEYMPVAPEVGGRRGRIYRRIGYGPQLDVFCLDMRTYRDANGHNAHADPERGILGTEQAAWLLRELSRSRATWKVVAADMPLSVATNHADDRDSVAQEDGGAPLGREQEIARLLAGLKAARVRNVVWVTADVHYTAAHHYSPERATFTDFDPFWEFVSGPIAAGTFAAKQPDRTFGPEVVFAKGSPSRLLRMSPAAGQQYVGQAEIALDGRLTVTLHSVGDGPLWSRTFEPEPDGAGPRERE